MSGRDWAGRRIVVTGAASGIGRAAAALLREAGAEVTGVDLRDPGGAADRWIEADLTAPEAAAERLGPGPFHGLVNAAGLPPRPGQEALILRLNALALRAFTLALIDRLGRGAAIVNMASKAGARWRENVAQVRRLMALGPADDLAAFVACEAIDPVRAYDLSKEAVIAWTRAMTGPLLGRGLRINAVSPAAVETPILADFMDAFGARAARGVALTGRAGTPEEIARVIVFLLGPEAEWLRGCNIEADGGLTAQLDAEALDLAGLASGLPGPGG